MALSMRNNQKNNNAMRFLVGSIADLDENGDCINACIDAKPIIMFFMYCIALLAIGGLIYSVVITFRMVEDLNNRQRVSHRGMVERERQ